MLSSALFANDPLLEQIANDVQGQRISISQNRHHPAVRKIQQALLIWDANCLPRFGADGDYGEETAKAVRRFKVEMIRVQGTVYNDVGPQTVQWLDRIALANEQHLARVASGTSLRNPYQIPSSNAGVWALGFIRGFLGPKFSAPPPADITQVEIQPYSEGVLAGQQAAISGLEAIPPCVDAPESNDEVNPPAIIGNVYDATSISRDVWRLIRARPGAVVGFLSGLAVFFITLAVSLPVSAQRPEEVLPRLIGPYMDALSRAEPTSTEVFFGVGIDATARGCELRVTPLFPSKDSARAAVVAMGRRNWVLFGWRTDQSGGFRTVDMA